jgi:hypothetical protein
MIPARSGTIWSVKFRSTPVNALPRVVADGRGLVAVVTRGLMCPLLLTLLLLTVVVGGATAAMAQEVEPTIPPDTTTVPPETTTSLPPDTTTTFVPPTVAPTPPPTFEPATTTSIARSTSTTKATDSSVVADDRTKVDPAPGVVGPSGDSGTEITNDTGGDWWTAGTRLRLAVGGLGGLAMVVSVLTLLYWRHTRPDLTLGGEAESPNEPG